MLEQYSEKQQEAIIHYQKAEDAYFNLWINAQKGEKQALKTQKKISQNLEEATERLLRALEIRYRSKQTAEGREFTIRPVPTTSLGRFAFAIKRIDNGKIILPAPMRRLRGTGWGSWNQEVNTLELSYAVLVDSDSKGQIQSIAKPTTTELHEARHILTDRKSRIGKSNVFEAWIIPKEEKAASLGDYSEGASVDELSTSGLETYANYRFLRQAIQYIENSEGKIEAKLLPKVLNELKHIPKALPPLLKTSQGIGAYARETIEQHLQPSKMEFYKTENDPDGLLFRKENGERVLLYRSFKDQDYIAVTFELGDAFYTWAPADSHVNKKLNSIIALDSYPQEAIRILKNVFNNEAQKHFSDVAHVASEQSKAYQTAISSAKNSIRLMKSLSKKNAFVLFPQELREELLKIKKALDLVAKESRTTPR